MARSFNESDELAFDFVCECGCLKQVAQQLRVYEAEGA
jgi:hypothetical protein